MTTHEESVLSSFVALDRALVSKGFPATSPWWHQTIRDWYGTGKRQIVLRVGRRGGKSSTLSRLAVTEGLFGKHDVPPGDIGVVAVISTRAAEANERLRTICAILDALHVKYKPSRGGAEGVELLDRRVAFRVHVASIAGVSGFTGVFVLCDEVAKWKDLDTGSNPATEVIRSVRPTLLTQPNARIVLSSSPMSTLDAHYDAYEEGETGLQVRGHAPTWIANPSITEKDTHNLEPDETIWAREYAAIPQAENETSLLTAAALERVTTKEPHEIHSRFKYVAAMDPATRGNAWTMVVTTQDENGIRMVVDAAEWRGTRALPLVPGQVFKAAKAVLDKYNLAHCYTDQFAGDALREIARQHGVFLTIEPWSSGLKADAYESIKSLLSESRLSLLDSLPLRQDLLGIRQRITRSGVTYELLNQGSRHSDFAPAVAMALMHTKARAYPIEKQMTTQDIHEAQRNAYLEGRAKDRKDAERRDARLPVTHRRNQSNLR